MRDGLGEIKGASGHRPFRHTQCYEQPLMERTGLDRQEILIYAIVAFLVAALAFELLTEKPPRTLQPLGTIPAFSLTDTHGKKVTLGDMKGKVWLADFMYVHCATQCPLMTRVMEKVQEQWKGAGLYFVSFTMDPRDTPAELAQYAKDYGADTNSWFFLTGNYDDVTRLAKNGFKLPAQSEGGYDFVHSTRFTLVDRQGIIRGYYNSGDNQSLQTLAKDLRILLDEKP
jgi:protein SCO1